MAPSLFHLFLSLPHGKSTTSCTACSPDRRSSTSSFYIQYPLFSLRLSSSCLCLPPALPVNSILISFNSLLQKAIRTHDPTQLVSLLLVLLTIFLSPLDSMQHFSISHKIIPTDLHPSAGPHFKIFPCISDLLPEVSKFQHHTHLCPKSSTSLVSSLYISLMGRDSSVLIATRYGTGNPGIESRCGWDFSHLSRPPRDPFSLLYNGYWFSS